MKHFLLVLLLCSFSARSQGIYQMWGMASVGGKYDNGTIFSVSDQGRNLITHYNFDVSKPGINPSGQEMTEYNGALYGLMNNGGAHHSGILFKWSPDINSYETLHHFKEIDGQNPRGKLTVYNDKFYGVATQGGANGAGTIFEFDPETGSLSKKADLHYSTGQYPEAGFTVFGNKLYGTTRLGGTSGAGAIIEFDPAENVLKTIANFTHDNGSQPSGALSIFAGKLYGTCSWGGENSQGVIFEFDPFSGQIVKKHDFVYEQGAYPLKGLTLFNNKFYGTTNTGGTAYSGVIFEWDPVANTYTRKVNITDQTAQGTPQTSLILIGTKFYGAGSGGANQRGVIFEWDPANNSYTKKYDLTNSDGHAPSSNLVLFQGKLYGMTVYGGANESGILFEWDLINNTYSKKIDLNEKSGKLGLGSLKLLGGKLYGMTSLGGKNNQGVVFEYSPITRKYRVLYDLDPTVGYSPQGSLIIHDGKLYGTMSRGGSQDSGTVIEWDPVTEMLTRKRIFGGSRGSMPFGDLTVKDGIFYGTTVWGGSNPYGTIFRWNPGPNDYTRPYNFDLNSGGMPYGSLTLFNGKFYGMTSEGGANDAGVIFELDPVTNQYTKKQDFGGDKGAGPLGNLVLRDGKFYGLTPYGGQEYGGGTLFEWDPVTNVFTTKKHFEQYADGKEPFGSLVLNNGKFFGVTSGGGKRSQGTVFEWDPETNIFTKTIDIGDGDGQGFRMRHTRLELVPAPVSEGTPGTCLDVATQTVTAANKSRWVTFSDNEGNAVAEVNPHGNVLGNVNVSLYVHSGVVRSDGAGKLYLGRNLTVKPGNGTLTPGTTVSVRFYIKKDEYDQLVQASSALAESYRISSPSQLAIFKSSNDACTDHISSIAKVIQSTVEPWQNGYVFTFNVDSFSTFYIANGSYPALPVRLADFSAQRVEDTGLLTWHTTEESDFRHFEVLRSGDGLKFHQIGIVAPTENGRYNFTDTELTKVQSTQAFYRLKMVDMDGSFAYSAIRKIDTGRYAAFIYPNPVFEQLDVNWSGAAEWEIIHVSGARISSGKISGKTTIPASSLKPGAYILKITSGQVEKQMMFVKQ